MICSQGLMSKPLFLFPVVTTAPRVNNRYSGTHCTVYSTSSYIFYSNITSRATETRPVQLDILAFAQGIPFEVASRFVWYCYYYHN